ncbi:hypothetical protein [Streptomyces aureus]|uniref:hypothetical protein n=1 Tax=Streptomyces aureus TaxID=193461 RepID=UPI0033F20EFB
MYSEMLGGVIVGFLIAAAIAGASNLLVSEFESRLQRLPSILVRIAARAQPCADRTELTEEAEAELSFILSETSGLPLTRLWRGLRYAGGLVRASPQLSGEQSTASKWGSLLLSASGITMAAFSIFMASDGGWKFSPFGMLMRDFSDGPIPALGRLEWLAGMANDLSQVTLSLSIFTLGVAITFAGRVNFQNWTAWDIMKFPVRAGDLGIILFAFSAIIGGLAGIEICMHTSGGMDRQGVMTGLGAVAMSIVMAIFLGIAHKLIKKHVEESAAAATPA